MCTLTFAVGLLVGNNVCKVKLVNLGEVVNYYS